MHQEKNHDDCSHGIKERRNERVDNAKLELAKRLHAALVNRDWANFRALLTEDVTWSLPGENQISGIAHGADEVAVCAEKIAGFGLNFALKDILVSRPR